MQVPVRYDEREAKTISYFQPDCGERAVCVQETVACLAGKQVFTMSR